MLLQFVIVKKNFYFQKKTPGTCLFWERLAKTEKLDSELISKFGKIMEVTPTAYCSEEEDELQDYLSRRDQLVKMISMEKNRLALFYLGGSNDGQFTYQVNLALLQRHVH